MAADARSYYALAQINLSSRQSPQAGGTGMGPTRREKWGSVGVWTVDQCPGVPESAPAPPALQGMGLCRQGTGGHQDVLETSQPLGLSCCVVAALAA